MKKACEANYYDYVYSVSEHYRGSYRRSSYLGLWSALASMMSTEWRVVDLGCGPGQFAELLRDRGFYDYFGIDFSRTAIDAAREKFKKRGDFHFIPADLRTCPIPEADCYVMCEFLEHIEDDRKLLSRLPEGKKVIGSLPSFDCKGHVRFFGCEEDIRERYDNLLTFDKIERMGGHFVFSGVAGKGNVKRKT